MKPPRLVLVAAIAENGVIGKNGCMPWHLPGDLKHFKRTTLGKPVVMGRRTFDCIGRKPLPGRTNIVLTHDKNFRAGDVIVAGELDSALAIATQEAAKLNAEEIAIIGGSTLYAETLPRADRLYLTEIHAAPDGDTHFPDFDRAHWREIARDGPHRGADDIFGYSFVTLERQ